MNKRIIELARQSGGIDMTRLDIEDRWGGDITTWIGTGTPEFLERFAELIVEECAVLVDWILAEGGLPQGDVVREYFGVKK